MKNNKPVNKIVQSLYEKCMTEVGEMVKQKLNEAYESSIVRRWMLTKSGILYNFIRWDEEGKLKDCKIIDVNTGSISDDESFVLNVGQEYHYSEIREMMKKFKFNRSMHQAFFTIISSIYNAEPNLRHDNDFWWADKNYDSAKKYEDIVVKVLDRKWKTNTYGKQYVSDFTFKIESIKIKDSAKQWFHSFGVLFGANKADVTSVKSVIAISQKSIDIEAAKNHARKLNKYSKDSTFKTNSKRRENKEWYPFTANILKSVYKEGIEIKRRNPEYNIKQALKSQLEFAQLLTDGVFYRWCEKKEPELYAILVKGGFVEKN